MFCFILILPSLTFVEKNSSYINFDGIFQNSQKISSLVPSARSEESIIKTLLFYLTQKNSDLFFSNTVSTSVFDKFKCDMSGRKKAYYFQNICLTQTYLLLLQTLRIFIYSKISNREGVKKNLNKNINIFLLSVIKTKTKIEIPKLFYFNPQIL